jgi:hypothetical protein
MPDNVPTSEETVSFSFATSNEAITEAVSTLQAWISRCDAAAETEAHGRPWVDRTTGRVIGTVHNFDKAILPMGPDEAAAVSTVLAAVTDLRGQLHNEWRFEDDHGKFTVSRELSDDDVRYLIRETGRPVERRPVGTWRNADPDGEKGDRHVA